jgi:hypothetical protein
MIKGMSHIKSSCHLSWKPLSAVKRRFLIGSVISLENLKQRTRNSFPRLLFTQSEFQLVQEDKDVVGKNSWLNPM